MMSDDDDDDDGGGGGGDNGWKEVDWDSLLYIYITTITVTT